MKKRIRAPTGVRILLFVSMRGGFDLHRSHVLAGRQGHSPLEDLGEILGVGVAAPQSHVADAGEALLQHGAGVLDADGVEIFYDSNSNVAFENGGEVFFIVFQIASQPLQREVGIREMLVHVLLDQGNEIGPSLLVGGELGKPSTQIGEGVEQDRLAGDVRKLRGTLQAPTPDRFQLTAIGVQGSLDRDPQLVQNAVAPRPQKADVHISEVGDRLNGEGLGRKGEKDVPLLQGKNVSTGVKLAGSLQDVIHGIEGLQPQTRIDLLLGLQNEMDGVNAVVVDLSRNETTNVLLGHGLPP